MSGHCPGFGRSDRKSVNSLLANGGEWLAENQTPGHQSVKRLTRYIRGNGPPRPLANGSGEDFTQCAGRLNFPYLRFKVENCLDDVLARESHFSNPNAGRAITCMMV